MKRYIALLLAVLLCFTFAACRSKDKNDTLPETSEQIETAPPETEEPETEEPETAEPEPEEPKTEEGITPLLYKVSDSDSCIWLFGSIHVGTEEMTHLPDYVMDAFYSADALAVECNIMEIENDLAAQVELLKLLMYTDGTTIKDHIDPQLYKDAKAILGKKGYYSPTLDYTMPALWSNTIDVMGIEDFGYIGDNGIDTTLINHAAENGIKILEIESAEFQYGMLAGFSAELQEYMLSESASSYGTDEIKEGIQGMVEAWCNGTIEAYMDEYEDYSDLTEEQLALMDEYNFAMETERNITMTDYAAAALDSNDQIFICVGSAHVVGEGAMAQLLEEKGYTVEIVK